jgi:hypothetical protein
MTRFCRHLPRIYILASLSLVAALYLLYGGARRSEPTLVLEAAFAWMAVFIPPLFIVERSLALARMIMQRTGVPTGRPAARRPDRWWRAPGHRHVDVHAR